MMKIYPSALYPSALSPLKAPIFVFSVTGENFGNFGRPRSQISLIFGAAGENFAIFLD